MGRLSLASGVFGLACAASVAAAAPGAPSDHGVSGLWMVIEPQKFPADAPLTPRAKALLKEAQQMADEGLVIGDRAAKCLPVATPAMMVNEFALNVLEGPGQVMIASENNSVARIVYTDGRPHGGNAEENGWNGNSIGHWDGKVLAVDTTGFNDEYAMYKGATVAVRRTSALHLSERLYLESPDVLVDEMTYDDPGAFTRPVRNVVRYRRLKPPEKFLEYACEVQPDFITRNAAWHAAHPPERRSLKQRPAERRLSTRSGKHKIAPQSRGLRPPTAPRAEFDGDFGGGGSRTQLVYAPLDC